jgi:CubicO group peptidase (beta-lactamase class C family)
MKDEIRKICDEFAEKKSFSGVCLVKKGEDILFNEAHGYAHKGFKILNNLDTKFDTASITKTFTAVSVLLLIQKGFLNFDDKITDIIDLKGTEIPDDVTIQNLLTHTSGIADDADEEAGKAIQIYLLINQTILLETLRIFSLSLFIKSHYLRQVLR